MARSKRAEKQRRGNNEPQYNNRGIVQFKKATIPNILPRNIAQEDYMYHMADPSNNIIFAIGPAGTGKTLLCTMMGVKALKEKSIRKLIVTRPAVSVDEQHGFLPGDLNEKMAPWTRPIFDILEKYFTTMDIEGMLEEKIIEIAPLAYMRGRTFEDAWIIADEMQLTTPNQMKMLLTRIGNNTKLIVTGDLEQADRGKDNGLVDFLERMEDRNSNRIAINRFSTMDIERHPVVEEIIGIYNEK